MQDLMRILQQLIHIWAVSYTHLDVYKRQSLNKSITVNLQVVKGNAVLTKIQQPAAVTGLANGTKKDAASLKLPSTVAVSYTHLHRVQYIIHR